MDINKIEIGKEYIHSHAYGQPDQKVKILDRRETNHPKWGKSVSIDIEYTSEDSTKGMRTSMNTIECERYLHEI